MLATSLLWSAYHQNSVWVFERQGSSWRYQNQPFASQSGGYISVALNGDTLAIGTPFTNQVQVWVHATGINWNRQALLDNPGGGDGDAFGYAMSLSADTLIVGAPGRSINGNPDSAHGGAYVFTRSGTNWSLQATLDPNPDPSLETEFGQSVAISGDTALVGANRYLTPLRAFSRRQGQWAAQELDQTVAPNDYFGYAVAIDGLLAVVGGPNLVGFTPGHAYVLDGSGLCARFARCDPNIIWVDFNYTGTQTGCSDQPYNSLVSGVLAVPTGGNLAIKPGSTSLRPRLIAPMRINACGGPATIGK
jgi:hypothetical protein